MFDTLIESRARRPRSAGTMMPSLMTHAAIVAWAVVATQHPDHTHEVIVKPEPLVYMKAPEPIAQGSSASPDPARRSVSEIVMPTLQSTMIEIVARSLSAVSSELPDPTYTSGSTPTGVFVMNGSPGGSPNPTTVFNVHTVDKPAILAPGAVQPTYPSLLREAGVEGSVLAQFVVDSTGRAIDSTITIVSSTHDRFSIAVRNALPRMRFIPAEANGHRVRQLVQQPFDFALAR